MPSLIDITKRALVTLLRSLALAYGMTLSITRDSPDQDIHSAYRKVSRKTHPDRGGTVADQTALNNEHDAWQEACRAGGRGGPRQAAGSARAVPVVTRRNGAQEDERGYRFQSKGILLTYQKFPDTTCWKRFLDFLSGKLSVWKVQYWCATLETNLDGTHHLHLMLQFFRSGDRNTASFIFEGFRPNGQSNDLLGEGWTGKKHQRSLDRGFFYVWAAKEGTAHDGDGNLCVDANYKPAWTKTKCTYAVAGRWLDNLFQSYKLSLDIYEEYVFLAGDGVCTRKRNIDAIRAQREGLERKAGIEERAKRLRSNRALYVPFAEVPEAQAWLKLFETDALRYPMLVVLAPSHQGKTEWAKSLFDHPYKVEVGALTHFPEKMRAFDRKRYDGIVLDDVRDMAFLAVHQEKLQGNYDAEIEFASTAGGRCAYEKDLWRVPLVATVNYSTHNLQFLASHDFLSKKENVHFLCFSGRPGEAPPQTTWPVS